MAFRRLERRVPTEIPTSSMADIAFLLIIFFMLTAVFTSTKGIQTEYPEDNPEQNVQPEESIHIKIEGEGQFVVDRTPMTLESMGGYVKGRIERNPNKPVIIETDPEVPYYVMIEVFDLLRFLEVEHVSVPTKSERELWKQFFQ